MKKLKIAIIYDVIYLYVKGGVEKRISDLAERLSEKHEVYVFGMKYWKGPRLMKKGKVNYYGVCKPLELYTKSGRRSIIQPLYFSISLLPALMKFDFDIIDCQNFPYFPCFSAKIYSIIRKKPLIITWCEAWGGYWYKYLGIFGWFGKKIEKLTAKLTKNHVSLSELTAERLASFGIASEVIEPGINIKKIGINNEKKKSFDVVFVGRLIREKNADVLVKAIKLTEANAVIIGGGPEMEKISRLTDELGLRDRVKLTGYLEEKDMLKYLKSSKVFVTLSEREGYSIVVHEAMALGLPVVTLANSNNAASSRVLSNLKCSLSENDVAEKISALLDDNKMADKATEHSKATIQRDTAEVAEIVEDFYINIAKQK